MSIIMSISDDFYEQENEILALSSIFDDQETLDVLKHNDNKERILKFVIDIELPQSIEIYFKACNNSDTTTNVTKSANVLFLPPIYASITLPIDYPSSSNPEVHLSASWLYPPVNQKIVSKLKEISDQNIGLPVLFLYYQCIKDECFLLMGPAINLNSSSSTLHQQNSFEKSNSWRNKKNVNLKDNNSCKANITSITYSTWEQINPSIKAQNCKQLFDTLVDYNDYKLLKKFESEKHLCQICYTELYGSLCLQFTPCGHVFCKPCCKQFFELHITEGSFELLKCLAQKCDTLAIPKLIKSVVDDACFERYDRMTLTRSLDMMQDVVICPKSGCGAFVVMDGHYKNMALCNQCSFAFCTLCHKVYHGLELCSFSSGDAELIADEYNAGDEELRSNIEKKYGQMAIKRLVGETLSSKWMSENCRQCPTCKAPIEVQTLRKRMGATKCCAQNADLISVGCAWNCLTKTTRTSILTTQIANVSIFCLEELENTENEDDGDDSD